VKYQPLQTICQLTRIQQFFLIALPLGKKKGKQKKEKTKTTFLSILVAVVFFTMLVYLSGCSEQPTDPELERLRQEAIAQNYQIAALQEKRQAKPNWQFTVHGRTALGQPIPLSWSKLETLATTSVWTTDPHHTSDAQAIFHFRGVAVSTLLDEFDVAPNVTDITFVAYDAYRSTVTLDDLRQYPIIIALERNHKKISRSDGGPLYLVFPQSKFPQLRHKYFDRFWVFYITDLVVGTEPIKLQVGKQILDAAAINKLPHITIEETVGYRIGWPANKVKLYGVRLSDVIADAGLKLSRHSVVIVRGKSPIDRSRANPIRLEAADLKRCDILLATHWGDEQIPIPASMGGPVTLAFSSACQTPSDDRRWVTFVEELEVTQ
jgi:hypothetical protein